MNKNILSKIVIFAAGALTGSAVTCLVVKKKYERLAQEEIEIVREVYAESQSKSDSDEESDDEEDDDDMEEEESYRYNRRRLREYAGDVVDEEDEDEDEYEEVDMADEREKAFMDIKCFKDLVYLAIRFGGLSEEEYENMGDPYVVSPEEYDENGYATVTLFYFEDGVLAYGDTNEVVDNVDELVGEDSLNHFGEFEEDSVFVRNDRLGIDFEILKDIRRYSEVD